MSPLRRDRFFNNRTMMATSARIAATATTTSSSGTAIITGEGPPALVAVGVSIKVTVSGLSRNQHRTRSQSSANCNNARQHSGCALRNKLIIVDTPTPKKLVCMKNYIVQRWKEAINSMFNRVCPRACIVQCSEGTSTHLLCVGVQVTTPGSVPVLVHNLRVDKSRTSAAHTKTNIEEHTLYKISQSPIPDQCTNSMGLDRYQPS